MDLVLARFDRELEEPGDLGARRVQVRANELTVRNRYELNF
jgi:hypothetical protein